MGTVRVRAMGSIRIRVTVGVIDGVCGVVQKKVLPKKYWYRYWHLLFSTSIGIGIGIGNTFCQSIGIGNTATVFVLQLVCKLSEQREVCLSDARSP